MNVFVVVPAFDEADRIGACLTSLAAQTYRDFRVVLVDNGSTDGTATVARDCAEATGLSVEVVVEPVRGVGSAADTGFRYAIKAGADVVARVDADAVARPQWLAAALDAIATGTEVAAGRCVALRSENGAVGRARFATAFAVAAAFGRVRPANRGAQYQQPYVMVSGNNVACTAEVYLRSGGWPRRPSPTDRDFTNAVRRCTARLHRVPSMVVENSTRRLDAYGLVGAARWYLTGQAPTTDLDPR